MDNKLFRSVRYQVAVTRPNREHLDTMILDSTTLTGGTGARVMVVATKMNTNGN